MAFNDFVGQELAHGDSVVLVAGKYVELRRGIVVSFTPQKVRVMTRAMYSRDRFETILIFPAQCVRVDEAVAVGKVWDLTRAAATEAGS